MGDPSGKNVLRVAELMFKQINADGGILGRQCEIVGPIDDHMETAQAITGFETFVARRWTSSSAPRSTTSRPRC